MTQDFQFRPATSQDHPLIYSATAKSLRSSPYYTDLPGPQYTQLVNHVVGNMLARPWQQTIAHPQDYPQEIAGFILHSSQALGFCYVKEGYRERGLGRQLLEHATASKEIVAVLAQPKVIAKLRDKGYRVRLSPYLAL